MIVNGSTPARLAVRDLSHRFGSSPVLKALSLIVAPGQIVCLVGPSGCGKSTLLRMIAGLEGVQSGSIEIDGDIVANGRNQLAPERRGVGMVFQDLALFPHLSVIENVMFGLGKLPRPERADMALRMLERVGLSHRASDLPHRLSGGQQQRVALARALVTKPRLLLLDEPFSSLDIASRGRMQSETQALLKAGGMTALMVTHDPEEAMMMADLIAVMAAGRIAQFGSPSELYQKPVDGYVAAFFGEVNRLAGIVAGGAVATPLGSVAAPSLAEGSSADIRIRPEAIQLVERSAQAGTTARVVTARMLGGSVLLGLSVENGSSDGLALQMRLASRDLVEVGATIRIGIDPQGLFVFPA